MGLPVWIMYPTRFFGKKRRKGKKLIFASNHFSIVDMFLLTISYHRQIHYVGKKEWADANAVSRFLMKHLGAISFDRGKPDLLAVKAILGRLKENKVVGIFPEGTRNKNDEALQEIKIGTTLFALKARAEIVPSIIWRKPRIFRFNRVLIGDPINFGELYDRQNEPGVREEANNILIGRMAELRSIVNFYSRSSARFKRALRKDFKNTDIKMSEIIYKYNIKGEEK
jgi:1-acyl-sn-glycerol-3-phosphate acyltransferase